MKIYNELKSLGFFKWLNDKHRLEEDGSAYVYMDGLELGNVELTISNALAFRWFREKQLSDACICRYQSKDDGSILFYYVIYHDYGVEETRHYKEGFNTYEEAELACLRKLIKIVKKQSN